MRPKNYAAGQSSSTKVAGGGLKKPKLGGGLKSPGTSASHKNLAPKRGKTISPKGGK